MFRRWFSGALVVGIVAAGSVLLGVAAPAEALQAPPVGPPKLTIPSSVIGGAVSGGTTPASSGAELGGEISREGGKLGAPAFKATSVVKTVGQVQQVIAAFQLGQFVGGAIDAKFGIDKDGLVCGSTADDLGGTVLRTIAGSDCDAYKPVSTYTPNTDAGGYSMATTCGSTAGNCVTGITGTYKGTNTVSHMTTGAFCFSGTGSNVPGVYLIWSKPGESINRAIEIYGNSGRNDLGTGAVICGSLTALNTPLYYGADTGVDSFLSGVTLRCLQPAAVVGNGSDGYPCTKTGASSITANSPNPTRWKVCTITTTDGGTYSDQTASFYETDPEWPADKCPVLPAGKIAGHMTITLNGGPQVITLQSMDSTPEYQAAATAYPNCSSATCTLDLLDGTGSCYSGDSSRCATWVQDPNRDSKYKCKYGTYDVPLSECFALGNAFDAAKVAAGNGIADPATGNDTGTQTTTKPSTGSGGSADPATGDDRPDCWPSGWAAFNPLNWVLQPIQCAFTPRKSVIAKDVSDMQHQWDTKMPAQMGKVISTVTFIPPTASGCNGITIPIAWLTHKDGDTMQIMNACPGQMLAPVAMWSSIVGDVMFTVFGVMAIGRYIAGTVGFGGFGSRGTDGD